MGKPALMTLLSAGLAMGVVGATAGGASAAKCKAGLHSFGSAQARTFCGPGSAQLTLAGKKVSFKGGNCVVAKKYVTINLGTIVLGNTSKPRPEYFGLTVGRTPAGGKPAPSDGTYTGAVIAFEHLHKGYALGHSSVTLTNKRTRGTFTGTLPGGGIVAGSFRCK
jgi:hypothetical protein